ncbi:ParB N-terminal domain-containing protein [Rhodococcus hoagii]|nr:ParB N-terminal domain-containing protein [Prescottella equi]
MHPILAERRDDGTILVTDGQRRLLAARAANRTSVPVIIRPQENGTDNARKATRIGQQIVSNDQREALTDGQRAAGIAAMLDLACPRPPSLRQPASPGTRSRPSRRSAHRRPLAPAWTSISFTIEQAATIAEFEEAGDTEGINRLLSYGSHYQFDYMAERLRRDRVERIAHAERPRRTRLRASPSSTATTTTRHVRARAHRRRRTDHPRDGRS